MQAYKKTVEHYQGKLKYLTTVENDEQCKHSSPFVMVSSLTNAEFYQFNLSKPLKKIANDKFNKLFKRVKQTRETLEKGYNVEYFT